MSIDYTFALCIGFELDKDEVEKPFKLTNKYPGEFHMEDRFDPKTGAKIEPVKIWDKKPKTERWYEIDGVKYDDFFEMEDVLGKKFDCYVGEYGSFCSGDNTYVFCVNDIGSYKDAGNYGNITVYDKSLTFTDLPDLMAKAYGLRERLQSAGYNPGEPKVFIAQRVS